MKEKKEEDDEREYPIRVYSKEELAMLYNPDKCIDSALQCLYRWIRMNKMLVAELEKVGYYKWRRSFTPLEVKLIFRYLGEPG